MCTARFWALSEREWSAVRAEGRKRGEDASAGQVGYLARVLCRTARDPDQLHRPALRLDDAMALTEEELVQAVGPFFELQYSLPDLATLDDENLDAWVARLAEGVRSHPESLIHWGSPDSVTGVGGFDPNAGFLGCHFLCWAAARRTLYADKR